MDFEEQQMRVLARLIVEEQNKNALKETLKNAGFFLLGSFFTVFAGIVSAYLGT